MSGIRVPARALPAWEALHEAIARTGPTPCAGEDGPRWQASRIDQAWAAMRCLDCPVMTECDTYAVTAREDYGVWGGRTAEERQKAARRG